MFLGMQGELIAFARETREELENIPCVEFSEIVETSEPVEMVGNSYYVGEEAIIEAKKVLVRNFRDYLLKDEIDPIVSNPLRYADMSESEKQKYADYRRYLLDYTKQEGWYLQNPVRLADFVQ